MVFQGEKAADPFWNDAKGLTLAPLLLALQRSPNARTTPPPLRLPTRRQALTLIMSPESEDRVIDRAFARTTNSSAAIAVESGIHVVYDVFCRDTKHESTQLNIAKT